MGWRQLTDISLRTKEGKPVIKGTLVRIEAIVEGLVGGVKAEEVSEA